MNTFSRILTLSMLFTSASTTIASAMTPPDPCAESVSCRAHQLAGSTSVASVNVPQTGIDKPIGQPVRAQAFESSASPDNEPPHTGPVESPAAVVMGKLSSFVHELQTLFVYSR